MDRSLWTSLVLGPAALWIALAAAALVVAARGTDPERLKRVVAPALTTVALQAAHFGEEFATGFHRRFFPQLGLAPWPDALFAGFNLAWIAVWLIAVGAAAARRASGPAATVLTFLAIAAVVNGIVHPLLSLRAGGYFPGLFSSIPLALGGLWLWRRLAASGRRPVAGA
jgi:hypothetical protein